MPTLAAFGAMAAESSGPVAATRELWAGMQELVQAAKTDYPDNALIQDVTWTITRREDGGEMSVKDWHANGPETLDEAIVEQALRTAGQVNVALQQASPGEAAQYRAWITGIAEAGVRAAATGFLGLGGDPVSTEECQFLKDLGAALGENEGARRAEEPGARSSLPSGALKRDHPAAGVVCSPRSQVQKDGLRLA